MIERFKKVFYRNFKTQPSTYLGLEVFNPYSNLDKFRGDAFRRIPGVVNFAESKTEAILRDAQPLDLKIQE